MAEPLDRVPNGLMRWALLAALALLTVRILHDFLEPLAWSAILAYTTWPGYRWLRARLGERPGWSALAMVAAICVLLLIPLLGLSIVVQRELPEFIRSLPGWLEAKPELPAWLTAIPLLGDELGLIYEPFEDVQGVVRRYLLPRLVPLSGNLLNVLEGAGFLAARWLLAVVLLFFAYRDGHLWAAELRKALRRCLGEDAPVYRETAERTIRAVFYGIVMTAIVQGAVAGIGYWAAGMPSPALLTLVTMLAALIPFGSVPVWVAAGLWLLGQGESWAGLGLLAWGALAVSWVDNLVRPVVISRSTRIPFLAVMLGVLGGLTAFGVIGLFVGPTILALALAAWHHWLRDRPAAEP